jgi:energy-converting hydrogenase Eha subunit F
VIESRTCLLPMITPASRMLLRLHKHYGRGVLPYPGGLLQQPNYYAEAMEILSDREAQIQRELVEREKRRPA